MTYMTTLEVGLHMPVQSKGNMTDKEKIKKIIRILNKHVEDVGDLAWQIRKITEIVTSKKR